jgi:Uma2 family endonuclease
MGLAKLKSEVIYSTAEYLEFERNSTERHGFIDGEIFAMAGESPKHSIVKTNLIGEMVYQLKGKICQAFSPNMKVQSGHYIKQKKTSKGLFSYLDLTVVCGEPKFLDENSDVLINPKVIFEILSPATEAFDRGEKFSRYRAWNLTLTDYVLIWQDVPAVEHFQRQDNNHWLLTIVEGLESILEIASIECSIKLVDLYDRIDFEQ